MAFKVNITLDIERFNIAITDINKKVRDKTDEASVAAARYLADEVRGLLGIWVHPAGTPSPTKPFKGPPGFISGRLMESVDVRVMPIAGFAKVEVGSVYARIQEVGGFAGHHHSTYIPPRPYFRPTAMDMRSLVGIEHIFYDKWREAMLEALPPGLMG